MVTLTIRPATDEDTAAVYRLAALDSAAPPTGTNILVAEVDGALWAALDLDTGIAIADPFEPSGELVGLLRFRAGRLKDSGPLRAPRKRRLLPRLA